MRGSVGYNQSSARIRSMFSDLQTSVSRLRSSLTSVSSQLTSHELNRRKDAVESLSRKAGAVRDLLQESSTSLAMADR